MSNYHVLQTTKKDRAQIAFHIAVPNEVNASGVNLQTAASQFIANNPLVSNVPWLETDFSSEYAQIEGGQVYEHYALIEYDANLTNVQKLSNMDDKYNSLIPTIQNEIRDKLAFWGLNRDVT